MVNNNTYSSKKYYMGYIPDMPDFRDYTKNTESVRELILKLKLKSPSKLPQSSDQRQYFGAVFDQGNIGSCTANAAVGIVEYFENRSFGKYIPMSRLFLYKITRNLIQTTGDTGAQIRNTMGALTTLGICPEKYLPYDTSKFDEEPSSMCYALSQDYKTTKYVRLDYTNIPTSQLLIDIKTNIANGIPPIFGFPVYDSYMQAEKDGKFPYPSSNENIVGGHAMVACGYDDTTVIDNSKDPNNKESTSKTGALLVRNSWGDKWGDKGYGWLPYEYIIDALAIDWWVLLDQNWIDTDMFGF